MDFEDEFPVTLSGLGGSPDPAELGGCRIEARLSAGTGGRVFRAVDLALGRTVVVKLMGAVNLDDDPGARARFLAAGEAVRAHPVRHVVPVLRTGQEGDNAFIVYEFVDGEDLERATRRERALVPAAAARAILDAAQGLAGALEHGIVHGDVRPRHLLRARGETRVTGFSLSPPFVTAQGRKLRGHPAYIAPELAGSGIGDHRSDIYALGCTLYELVTGRPPFGNTGADALVACHVHEPFPTFASQQHHRVPDELERFLERLVAKQPSRRFATYTELLQAGAAMLPALRRLVPQQPAIVVEDGRQAGLRVNIHEGDFLLGRTPGEGIQIDDARCSRRHALIRRSGDYMEVEDLGSRNGIKVNGVEVRNRQLFPGDRIEIGDTTMRIEGATAPVQQQPAVPASPVRGAFGDVEVTHPPVKQASSELLSQGAGPGAEQRIQLLGKLAPLLSRRTIGAGELESAVLAALADTVGANDHLLLRVANGQPVFEAQNSHEAQVLSCLLPAVSRALPGQLSVLTAVKVGRDDRWSVILAPILRGGAVVSLIALVKQDGRFDESALSLLEACCSLLGMRE